MRRAGEGTRCAFTRLTLSCTSVGRELPNHRSGRRRVRERGWSDRNAEGERVDDAGRERACETVARAVVRLGGTEARGRTRSRLAAKQCEKSRRRVEKKNCAKRVTWILRATFLARGRRHIEQHVMTRTMKRAVALLAALALASVWHADAACASTQTFKALAPSVRAWKKDTFSNVAHDTPILEGTIARVTERVSRTGPPTLTSYPPSFSPLLSRSKPAWARIRTRWSGSPRKTERCAPPRIKNEPRRVWSAASGKKPSDASSRVAASSLIVPDPFPITVRRTYYPTTTTTRRANCSS